MTRTPRSSTARAPSRTVRPSASAASCASVASVESVESFRQEPAVERMATVDTAWLRIESDANPMMIVGVWFLRPPVPLAEVRERVRDRLLRYPRFRQRVGDDEQGACWIEEDEPDLAHHVVAQTLRRRRGQSLDAALQACVAELAAQRLDHARPLWQLHLIEDYDGGGVLIARIHHCIADGMALIAVMLAITDDAPQSASANNADKSARSGESGKSGKSGAQRPRKPSTAESGGDSEDLADALLKPISDWTVRALRESRADPGDATSPDVAAAALTPGERLGAQMVQDMAALAFMEDDAPTRLKGRLSREKRVAWAPGVTFDAVQAVSRSLGVSVNDVLLSCVAGAIGAYLRGHGDDTTDQEIRAMVPVNLRPLEEAWELGNRFGVVPVVLPIGIANPVKRLYAVHQRMREVKGSLQPVLAFGLMAAAGLIRAEDRALLSDYARKATAVMTNVPGPAHALRFCGSTVERVLFWVPQSGDVGLGVSLLSYAGQVQFGVMTDAAVCPDPERIVEHFDPEFQRLLTLALMLPWESQG